MDSTESEHEQSNEQPEKIDRRKIIRASWRHKPDGTYNDKPNDPLYFQKYWNEKRKEKESTVIICDKCQKKFTFGHLTRHLKSNYHIKRCNQQI